MPALDLALGLWVIRCAPNMLDAPAVEPFGQIAGDIGGTIVGQQPRAVYDRDLIEPGGGQRQVDDLGPDLLGNAVPDAPRPGRTVAQSLRPAGSVKIVPAVKRGPWNAELLQGSANRQVGLLDQADDLGLFGCGVSHAASPPSPIMLFLSRRFSRVRSATTSFKAEASRHRSFTSSDVAARAVSPASRFLPASRKSFDQP